MLDCLIAWLSGTGMFGAVLLALINALKQQGAAEERVKIEGENRQAQADMTKEMMKERTTAQDIKDLDDGAF